MSGISDKNEELEMEKRYIFGDKIRKALSDIFTNYGFNTNLFPEPAQYELTFLIDIDSKSDVVIFNIGKVSKLTGIIPYTFTHVNANGDIEGKL